MESRELLPLHRGYPARLRALTNAPVCVWLKGLWQPALRSVAVVGARAATARGLGLARAIATGLVERGVDVISGGALGIDAAAHRGALDATEAIGIGRTVAVLGTGIDVLYPQRNAGLFHEILSRGGALLSQFPPGSLPKRSHFPARNTVIAALSDLVLVVEASLASGAMYTVRAMRLLGRLVAAVPGSLGTDRLIAAGALPVTSARDLLLVLDGEVAPAPVRPSDPLAARIYALLDEVPRDVGELARSAGVSVGACAELAADLELDGLATRAAGGRYLRLR